MPALEVADIFRRHGEAYRQAHAGHLGRTERRVMGAIEACRTAALGGHVERCAECGLVRIAYNSCRNRHCPKCQGPARAAWLAERQAELLPVPYFHVVFTLPAPAAEIAFQNKAAVYAILFKAAAETLSTIAADPRHLGAEIGFVAVLHTWGQNLQHHPHVHCLVPGGGLSSGRHALGFLPARLLPAGARALAPVPPAVPGKPAGRVRGRQAGVLRRARPACRRTRSSPAASPNCGASSGSSMPSGPFAGPAAVLAYLGRYTHRVAIANSRLIALAGGQVSFRWRDYRHHNKNKVMTLAADEFIRRFLLHALPDGFHRIRHYGFLANRHRAEKLALCRKLLDEPARAPTGDRPECRRLTVDRCPCCGGRMEPVGVVLRMTMGNPLAGHDSS